MVDEQPIHSLEEWMLHLGQEGIIAPEFFEHETWYGDKIQSLMGTVKAHDGISTSGLFQRLYGTDAVVNIIYSEDIHGVLRKIPYLRSGHRVLNTPAATTGGSVALGGAVPAGDQRTYSTLYTTPKLHTKSEDIDLSYMMLEGKDEQVNSDQLIRDMISEWADLIDRALAKEYGTLASTNLESIDRLTASSVERAACGEDDNDENFMGVDKATATWFNPYVDHGGSGGTEMDRDLKTKMFEDALAAAEPYAKGPDGKFAYTWLTGYTTWWRTANLLGPAFRREALKMTVGVNGLSTDPGSEYSERISTIMDHPFLKVNRIAQDTIDRIYGINNNFSGIKVLAPANVVSTNDIHKTQNFFQRTTVACWEELYTDLSKAQIKIRGLR